MRPLIGVTSNPVTEALTFVEFRNEAAPELYLDMLSRQGALAVVLPVHGEFHEEVLDRLDGVVLTGGVDVEPSRYGAVPGHNTDPADSLRDEYELQLARAAARRNIPMLAVCRGNQLLNVSLGGTLIQDIASEVEHALPHMDEARWSRDSHAVTLAPDSRLGRLLGTQLRVNSMHHQAIARVGDGLEAVAWAPDGVIEAVEAPRLRFCVGVQWHPECLGAEVPSIRLFERFVRTAAGSPG